MTKSIDESEDSDDAKTEQAFANYDLKAEAPEARKPTVRFAFEFQTLLEMFIPADVEALESRRTSRVAGITAVALVLSAMLLASLGPILSSAGHASAPAATHGAASGGHGAPVSDHAAPADTHAVPAADAHAPADANASHDEGLNVHAILGTIAALLGLTGTVLGITGMRRSASRRKWLRARLTTETLRLFHFHYIVARLPEIVAVAGDAARRERYLADRAAALEQLKAKVLADPEVELRRIMNRKDETPFETITPMMVEEGVETPQAAADAFDVWRVLRVNWQAGYCDAKLERRHKGRFTIKQMDELFVGLGWFCVGAIILIHIGHFVGMLASAQSAWLEAAVIWTALIALAGRAMEDGFQPQREIERYEQYRANVRVTEERFAAARTYAAKLEVMRAFERSSLEEMRVFLRTHAKARFLL